MSVVMLYVRKDNVVKCLKIASSKMFVEMDGYHILPWSSIFRHSQGKDDAIAVVPQGRIVADGANQTKDEINTLLMQLTLLEHENRHPTIDSSAGRIWWKILRAAPLVFLLLLGIGIMGSMLMGGGV